MSKPPPASNTRYRYSAAAPHIVAAPPASTSSPWSPTGDRHPRRRQLLIAAGHEMDVATASIMTSPTPNPRTARSTGARRRRLIGCTPVEVESIAALDGCIGGVDPVPPSSTSRPRRHQQVVADLPAQRVITRPAQQVVVAMAQQFLRQRRSAERESRHGGRRSANRAATPMAPCLPRRISDRPRPSSCG